MVEQVPAAGPMGEVTCVEGQTFCVSGSTGQVRPGSEQGLYIRDTRVLDDLVVRIDGAEPRPLSGAAESAGTAEFASHREDPHGPVPDPQVLVERRRVVSESLAEELVVTNYGVTDVRLWVEVAASTDLVSIFDVKNNRLRPKLPAAARDGGLAFGAGAGEQEVRVTTVPQAPRVDAAAGTLGWPVELRPRQRWTLALRVGFREGARWTWPTRTWATRRSAGEHRRTLPRLGVTCSDQRVARLADQAVGDLESLLVSDPRHPRDRFLAAGSPWYLTLFGRDSLWAAFMSLPVGTDIAAQTLRTLARRQGRRVDHETEEAPGKILHEIRHGAAAGGSELPPVYYGSVDATPLFVTLLHEAWRWGMPEEEVAALVPAAEAALGWLHDHADADGDGFVEYRRSGSRGLANQGWKDSADAVQFADGRLADPPIALAEVQGYAYEAARRGAELLARFARPGAARWRSWADALADRFRGSFWVDDAGGPYPAIALDGGKQPADSLTSNIGHLPATGMLDEAECRLVARRLAGADMDSGWGLRTLSSGSPRFNPLSYHGGSVWPHDTAIAVHALALSGHGAVAGSLLEGLVRAAPFFGYRLPELLGGRQREAGEPPLPYPAACRPQAWAAGAALLGLRAVLGVHPNVPERRLVLRPMSPPVWRHLRVDGLQVGTGTLSVELTPDAGLRVLRAPDGLAVEVQPADG